MPSERLDEARRRSGPAAALADDSGSAVVDFVLVGVLVVALAVAVLQLALGLYARNVLTDAAGEGARRAALVGGTEAEARARVQSLTGAALADGYVDSVSVGRTERGGLAVVEVTVTAPLPVLGLLGPGGTLRATGHAVDEGQLVGVDGQGHPTGKPAGGQPGTAAGSGTP